MFLISRFRPFLWPLHTGLRPRTMHYHRKKLYTLFELKETLCFNDKRVILPRDQDSCHD